MSRNRCSSLPQEIISEILSRLPVKSIIRFRCVCKAWLSLTSDPNFIKRHQKLTSLDPRNNCLLFCGGSKSYKLFNPNSMDEPVALDFMYCFDREMIGVINGVVCLSWDCDATRFILWNAATKMYKKIRHPDDSGRFFDSKGSMASKGFGLDKNGDDFVIIRILSRELKKNEYVSQIDLFFTSSNSWKRINAALPSAYAEWSNCAIVKGTPYWVPITGATDVGDDYHPKNRYPPVLLSFDVQGEVFRQLPLPEFPPTWNNMTCMAYSQMHDCFSILVYSPRKELTRWFDIWMLDENECWNKKFSVGPLSVPLMCFAACSRNGEILVLGFGGRFYLFDTKTGETKYIYCDIDALRWRIMAWDYTESLVLIKGMKQFVNRDERIAWDSCYETMSMEKYEDAKGDHGDAHAPHPVGMEVLDGSNGHVQQLGR